MSDAGWILMPEGQISSNNTGKAGASALRYWRWLIAANLVFMAVYLVDHVRHDPYPITYIHYLVDYHFGFTKRALIGEIVSLVMDRVPPFMVFVESGTILVLAFALYLQLFRKTFGGFTANAPLFFFIVCSPFVFKHFIKAMGFFDIYGFLLAIVLLLIPARSLWFVVVAGIGSIILLLIHHLQMLLFIPAIMAIVIVRYYLVRPLRPQDIGVGLLYVVAIGVAFIAIQFFGEVRASPEAFRAYLATRVGGSYNTEKALTFFFIWFRTFTDEVKSTWSIMSYNLSWCWVYVVLFTLQIPLIRYIRDTVRAIESNHQRRVVSLLLVAISAGYLVIFATVFDYGRWMSGWAICMVLMLHAARTLPGAERARPIPVSEKWVFTAAVILSCFPKVGILEPLY